MPKCWHSANYAPCPAILPWSNSLLFSISTGQIHLVMCCTKMFSLLSLPWDLFGSFSVALSLLNIFSLDNCYSRSVILSLNSSWPYDNVFFRDPLFSHSLLPRVRQVSSPAFPYHYLHSPYSVAHKLLKIREYILLFSVSSALRTAGQK